MEETRRGPPWLKMLLAFWWAMPITALGVAACATIIGIPIGLFLFWFGCNPLAKLIVTYMHANTEYQNREQAMAHEGPKPWEEEEDECHPIVMYESTIERTR